jgi:hypothetical protein
VYELDNSDAIFSILSFNGFIVDVEVVLDVLEDTNMHEVVIFRNINMLATYVYHDVST